MILKMINEVQLTKQDRRKFIPFVNERNHMGEIIKNRQKDKQHLKSIEVFENLKKTTKQYFFDKKYQKMKQKLERYKYSLEPKQLDYQNKVKQCFRALQKSSSSKFYNSQQQSLNESNCFFVDLNEKLNDNISTLKKQIENNKKVKMESTISQFMKHNSVYNSQNRLKPVSTTIGSFSYDLANKQNRHQAQMFTRQKSLSKPNKNKNLFEKSHANSVNREIFKNVSPQSKKMADFTNCGLKYKHLVKTQSKDPWKKWYIDTRLEIFPGQVVKIKKLQKSIYD